MKAKNGQFTVIAEYYDRLNGADYNKYAAYVKKVLEKFGTGEENLLLDLGCGTGGLTLALADMGYDMIGVDVSADMLSVAYGKALETGNNGILFLMQDMRALELYGTVDAAVCSLDGINYLTEREDVLKCFKLVGNYLNPGALFLFDVNSEYRFREIFSKRDYFLEDENIYMGWRSNFNPRSRICDFYLTFFEREKDGRYRKSEETQREKLWTESELDEIISESGLSKVAVFSDMEFKTPDKKDEKRFYVLRRPFEK